MSIFRIFFVAVICLFYANIGVSQTTRTQEGSGAITTYDAIPTATKQGESICKKEGEPCRGYGALTASKCNKDLKCPITDCDNSRGFYYVVYEKTKRDYQKMGWCASEANCKNLAECKGKNCKLHTTQFNNMTVAIQQPTGNPKQSRKFLCTVFDDICTSEVLSDSHAITGAPIIQGNHDDDYCKPTKCESGYILPSDKITKDNSTCQKCQDCDPDEGATCTPNGSDGINTCNYTTACKDGYETLQNEGKYNPSCSKKIAECDTNKEAHNTAYNEAIQKISTAYKKRAQQIIDDCKKTGYIDTDTLSCVKSNGGNGQ